MAYKIAIIVGSLREGSINRKVARSICALRNDNLDCTMIEIRHDEILEPAGIALWADRLARTLVHARGALTGTPAPDHQDFTAQSGGSNG